MSDFQIHTADTAPEASRPLLEGVQKKMGFFPNLFGAFAESPTALKAYMQLAGIFDETTFTPTERQVILMTANIENGCTYCMAAHSTISAMQGIDAGVIEGLRNGTSLGDDKLEALRTYTRKAVQERGWVGQSDLDAFYAAGYGKAQVLEVIVGLALKTLSNYTNHVVEPPLDKAFQPQIWSPQEKQGAGV
jgi:uncharacterized peroxidase-related enzyme